jgi:uncharacterized protein
MLIDAYNVIHAWDFDTQNLNDSREKLLHILDDYAGFSGEDITVVFDGYNTKEPASETKRGLLTVIYTAYGISADIHIQRLVKAGGKDFKVVTADYLEQLSVFASGAIRVTPSELKQMIRAAREKYIALIDRSSLTNEELKKRLALDSIDF